MEVGDEAVEAARHVADHLGDVAVVRADVRIRRPQEYGVDAAVAGGEVVEVAVDGLAPAVGIVEAAVLDHRLRLNRIALGPTESGTGVVARVVVEYLQLSTAENIGYTTWTFWPPKSDTYVYEQMEKVLTGSLSPKDYCAGLDKLFQQQRKAGRRPPVPAPKEA